MLGLAGWGRHGQAAELQGHMSFFRCCTVTCSLVADSLRHTLPTASPDGLLALARTHDTQCD